MSKTYILQKDITSPLLSVKAGEPVRKEEGIEYYSIGDKRYYFESKYVENNPEWFLPEENNWVCKEHDQKEWGCSRVFHENGSNFYHIKKHDLLTPKPDSFQWTDELALEFLNAHRSTQEITTKFYWKMESVEAFKRFKQSHTPKPQAEKPHIVHNLPKPTFYEHTPQAENKPGAVYYGRPSEKEDFEADVKKAASYYGNNILCEECGEIGKHKKTCSKENKPDWEIVAMISDTGRLLENLKHHYAPPYKFTIHSVKRLSDGEVFSVGDEIQQGKITYIGIGQHGLDIDTCKEDKYHNRHVLWQLKKLPPQPQKLFTTEDGKDIFDGDRYWGTMKVGIGWQTGAFTAKKGESPTREIIMGGLQEMITFSTTKAAEKYIADNKPQPQKEEQRSILGKWEGANYYGSFGEKLFTQQQVDAMCEDAFNAAKIPYCKTVMGPHLPLYPTYQDYKNKK